MRAAPHAFLLVFCLLLPLGAAAESAPASPNPVGKLSPNAAGDETQGKSAWGEMPAGARSVYIGIHGGTMPVSLLTAGDGSPMIAQVGLTGTDFLYFMRRGARPDLAEAAAQAPTEEESAADAAVPAPPEAGGQDARTVSAGRPEAGPNPSPTALPPDADTSAELGELPQTSPVLLLPGNNATLLLAGRSGGDVPVIYATGLAFERMSLVPANWAPFGLTEKPLSMEGEVKILSQPKKLPRHKRRAGYRR